MKTFLIELSRRIRQKNPQELRRLFLSIIGALLLLILMEL